MQTLPCCSCWLDRQEQHCSPLRPPSDTRKPNLNPKEIPMKSTFAMVFFLTLAICLLSTVTSAQAVPAWQNNTAYKVGDLVTFNGQEYKCQIAHTSQADWTPDVAHSLWLLIQTATPDFSVSATPTQQSVTAGSAARYTVSAAAQNGFTGGIALSVAG